MAAFASAVGGIFSVLVLLFAAPLLARMAYGFGPPEYFALAVFGLSMLASIGGEAPLKNLIGGCLGLLIATVGVDLTTGVERFVFGVPDLYDGIHFVPVLIGLFAVTEALSQAQNLGAGLESVGVSVSAPSVARRLSQSQRDDSALELDRNVRRGVAGGRQHHGCDDRLQRGEAVVEGA